MTTGTKWVASALERATHSKASCRRDQIDQHEVGVDWSRDLQRLAAVNDRDVMTFT
jgi:hypothetical protein